MFKVVLIWFCFGALLFGQTDFNPEILYVTADTTLQKRTDGLNAGHFIVQYKKTDSVAAVYEIHYLFGAEQWVRGIEVNEEIQAPNHRGNSTNIYEQPIGFDLRIYYPDSGDSTAFAKTRHRLMLLTAEYQQCSDSVSLTWTPYIGWLQRVVSGLEVFYRDYVKSYNIYEVGENGFTLITTVTDTVSRYSVNYINTGLLFSKQVRAIGLGNMYMVEAVHDTASYTSFSNYGMYEPGIEPPEKITAVGTTNLGNNQANLRFYIEPGSIMDRYWLMGSTLVNGNYTRISEYNTSMEGLIDFDSISIPENHNYFKLAAVHNCNKPIVVSQACNLIELQGQKHNNNFEMIWNAYAEFENGVEAYEVYKSIGSNPAMVIERVSGNYFIDENYKAAADRTTGYITYYVLAHENSTANTSTSNEIRIEFNDFTFNKQFVVPNQSIGPEITPVPEHYSMQVYNRAGVMLADKTNEPWDGRYNGKICPAGTYIYHVKYNDVIKKGYFILLHSK